MTKRGKKRMSAGFIAIIIFKFFKAAVFLLFGIAALRLLRSGDILSAREIARFFSVSPENQLIRRAVELLRQVTPGQAKGVAVVALAVGAVFLTEGSLLAARIWWSTYFTIGLTACGIPLEILEILHRPSSVRRYALLVVNVAILLFLWKRRNEFRDRV